MLTRQFVFVPPSGAAAPVSDERDIPYSNGVYAPSMQKRQRLLIINDN